MTRADPIEEVAAGWLVRQDSGEWTCQDQAELDAWLDAAAGNAVAYYRLEQSWRTADRLAALRVPAPAEPMPRPVPQLWFGLAIAASLVLAGFVGLFVAGLGPFQAGEVHATRIGGRATVPFADGSRVELNTDTALRADISGDRRIVWLDRGEAYFDVARDPARPFQVLAGDRRITVLGTKFSVRRIGDGVQVNVVEGRVRVEPLGGADDEATFRILTRGQTALAAGPDSLRTAAAPEEVAASLSWRQGMILCDQDSLADAAAEFNRYNGKRLVIADADAAAMTISGRFEATNVDAFARLLNRAYGLSVRDDGARLTITR